jgi:hypothetical protein
MTAQKKRKLPIPTNAKSEGQGVPQIFNILEAAKTEPLNHPLTIKLPSSLAKYITEGPGPEFIRQAILDKLERLTDTTRSGRCSECANLTTQDKEPFCLWMGATFLPYDQKQLGELFHCDGFIARKHKVKRRG